MTHDTSHRLSLSLEELGLFLKWPTNRRRAGPWRSPSTVLSTPSPPPLAPVTNRMADVTLSGVVYELTAAGTVPIAGAAVYCEPCGAETHSWSETDGNGFYR